ncbi:hypothetical protein MIDIC_310013 [Alphaproteobacteria bacterium]
MQQSKVNVEAAKLLKQIKNAGGFSALMLESFKMDFE